MFMRFTTNGTTRSFKHQSSSFREFSIIKFQTALLHVLSLGIGASLKLEY